VWLAHKKGTRWRERVVVEAGGGKKACEEKVRHYASRSWAGRWCCVPSKDIAFLRCITTDMRCRRNKVDRCSPVQRVIREPRSPTKEQAEGP